MPEQSIARPAPSANLGRYIPLHASLFGHPKLRRLRRTLGLGQVQAVGHLATLWTWAMTYAADGDLSRYDADEIADAAEWEGEPERFISALVAAEFVDDDGAGGRSLHNWHLYGGRLEEQRKGNAERQARFRDKNRPTPTPPPTHPSGSNGGVTVTSPLGNALENLTVDNPTGENRTEENPTGEETTKPYTHLTREAGAPAREDVPAHAGAVCVREDASPGSIPDYGDDDETSAEEAIREEAAPVVISGPSRRQERGFASARVHQCFDEFMAAYPLGGDPIDTFRAYREVIGADEEKHQRLLDSIALWRLNPRWAARQVYWSPANFLRQGHWAKPPEAPVSEREARNELAARAWSAKVTGLGIFADDPQTERDAIEAEYEQATPPANVRLLRREA